MILNKYYIEVYEQSGGCRPRLVTLDELNTLISAEENACIGAWEAVTDENGASHATIASAINHIFEVLHAQRDATTPLVLSIADATDDYHLPERNQTVVINMLEKVNGTPVAIALPAARGKGIEYRIANKHATDTFDIKTNGTDVIDADNTISLTALTSCILVDVVEGVWAQF